MDSRVGLVVHGNQAPAKPLSEFWLADLSCGGFPLTVPFTGSHSSACLFWSPGVGGQVSWGSAWQVI